MVQVTIVILVTLVVGWVGVRAVLAAALRYRVLDLPTNRSSHSVPTPRGGGIGVVLATGAGVATAAGLGVPLPTPLFGAVVGCALLVAVSAIDDVRSLPASVRLLVHAAVIVIALVSIEPSSKFELPLVGSFDLGSFGWVLWLVFGVGLVNAYNFMDGADGMAGAQAVAAALGWAAAVQQVQASGVSTVALILSVSAIAFLRFNWSPARIFMGDAGSTFLGYGFVLLPMWTARSEPRALLVGVLCLWPFICDAAGTFIARALRGENVLQAHRSHLYQRLIMGGRSHAQVSLLYACAAALGAGLAAWLLRA